MPDKRFSVRELRPGDYKDLIANYYSYYDELKSNPDIGLVFYRKKPSYKSELEWFRALMKGAKNGTKVVSIATVDGRVVGMCEATTQRPGTELDHVGSLGIAIRDGYRSMGIGRALMEDVIRKSSGKYEMLSLAVFSGNTNAKRLYRTLGFKKFGLIRNSWKRNGRYMHEEFMYLNLKRFPRPKL